MTPPLKGVTPVDVAVITAYMALMLAIGVYAMRFNRGATDYFKGGSRIHWLAAGLSSFMSGFSAWTFTGAAGLAYQHGLVAVLLYVGNACTFLLGYFVFAARWRRARIGTVMEYLVDRYDERTRQAFSWTTIFFQLFMGAAMLYGLALFVAPTCGFSLTWTIVGSQAVILAYCVVGGLWAVVITDFLQAAILMPFTVVMFFAALARVGGVSGLLAGLPAEATSLALAPGYGWTYVLCWTVMTSFGYNTAAMAQRYFSVEDERASRKIALLCFSLFLLGAFIWFVPPFAMRVLHPDLGTIWPSLANPHESSYALAALTLLPSGLVGIMLAAMFSATMSSLSGLLNIHASIISRDIFPTLFPRRAGESERLAVAWTSTFAVGVVIMGIALAMAGGRHTVFGAMVTFNTVMSLAYGPPALLGLVVRRTPSYSGLAAFALALAVGSVGSFVLGWGLVTNVLAVVPASVAVFFLTRLFPETDPAHAARNGDLARRLDTPVDVRAELRDSHDPTAQVFRFLSRATGLMGLLCVPFVFTAPPGERATAVGYVAITLALAAGLAFVRGGPSSPSAPGAPGAEGSAASRAGLFVLATLLAAAPAAAGVTALWAVSDGEKVEREEGAHPLKKGNAVWDGTTIRLAAARNETVAFQVIVEADAAGLPSLSASLPVLRRRGGTETIAHAPPALDPSLSAGRPIRLYSVNYMNVTAESHASWAWKPGSPAAPRDTTGWKPVQLVPENARKGRGGFPLAVGPGLGQALWVEVDVPRDRPAGVYDGTLTVTADGNAIGLPVALRVFDFALPDTNSLPVMVFFEPDQPELYQGRNLDPAYHRFAHRHRIELVHAYDEATVEAHRGRFDGTDFTARAGYEGPGEGVGHTIVPASFYGPGPAFEQKESAWKRADAWMAFLSRTVPNAVTFLYLPDEPYPAQYPEVRRLAENVRSNPGPGGKLPLFLTKRIIPEFQGLVDIWSLPPQAFDIQAAAAERARGRRVSFYNGGRPQGPTPVIDAPATEARAVAWAAFKHDVDLYFYWHGVHWRHNRQKQGERRQNVWANPITFDNRGQPRKPIEDQGFINGDGALLYPGEEKLHPQEDRGIAGPIASVQLANLRRGLQDHQYLTVARKLGLEAEVKAALALVVPRVFSDAGETVGFAETGETYEAARRALGEAIERVTPRDSGSPGPEGPAGQASPGAFPRGEANRPVKGEAQVPSAPVTAVAPRGARPRLFLSERDPFAGLPTLRARWAAGERPTTDLAGLALSWLLSGDESFARRAVDELRADLPTRLKGSSAYVRYLNRSMAFDWLYGYSGFDAALKDAVATDLVAGAERMLALPSLKDAAQASYHNHTVRELALAVFSLTAVEGHPSVEARATPLRAHAWKAFDNVLEQTELVNPDGGYHESTDYMRITWAPLAMMAEVRRTATGEDPALRASVFRNMAGTYLYKVLPDGTCARDDDNEFPHLDSRDNVVLGYAVHRFKDPYAAWLLRQRDWLPAEWANPVLRFLWADPSVVPRDPAATTEGELPRHRLFRGIGHLVLRDGWGKDSTWIQLACGPYFAKHDHLDAAHLVVYRKGYLAIDAGADYTDTESPHYLNHYRRTVAHNTMLVYQPGEASFWGENLWPAANDGGQRMDSSRFWNSVRSLEDWRRTRDLWDRCTLAPVAAEPAYRYARADATRAYQPSKLDRFTREIVHLREPNLVVVLDRVRAKDPAYRKAWLLHGVSEPVVAAPTAGTSVGNGGTGHREASLVTFEDGHGRLRVHSLLPREREVVVRGGTGFEFWTPGDDRGGRWGSGRNWPLDPPEGGPLPADPYLLRMWRTFWEGIERLAPSNRRAVVPGAWRMEVSPTTPSTDDVFLNVLEIGDRDATPARRVLGIEGHAVDGAAIEGEAVVLFADGHRDGEATLPDVRTRSLLVVGLEPGAPHEVQVTSSFAPGAPAWQTTATAGDEGTLLLPWDGVRDGRLRLRRLR